MHRFHSIRVYLCSSVALLAFGASASAQVQNLDQTTLIDALAEEGMSDLLLRLIETDPPKDPAVAAQVEIAQHKLRYADPSLSREEQLAAYGQALDRTRQLIKEQWGHEQRPIWQTDLAEMLLTEYLGVIHQNAALFDEFGVPSAEQKQAFESASVEALEATASASLRFFQLQGELPREPDHAAKRVDTGLWRRMIEDYYEKRTPFYLAHAALGVALLPPDHPYWSQPNESIAEKLADAAKEKVRLTSLAEESVRRFANDRADAAGVRAASLALIGRAQLVAGKPDEAIATLNEAIAAKPGDAYELSAHLGVAQALAAKKQFADASNKLAGLADLGLVKSNLLYRLLLTDARHRVLLAEAEAAPADRRDEAVAAAYEPYLALLGDPSLGEQAAALQGYVYARWAANVPAGGDVSGLPPVVRMAVGEMSRIEGQNAVYEAEQTGDDALRERGVASLRRAIAVCEPLIGADMPPTVRARAMFNLGLATYFTDRQGLANILRATETFVTLANEVPDQPQAEEAISAAVQLLRELHQLEPRPATVDEAYQKAVAVLFEQFPTSSAADNERLYYGYAVLAAQGRYVEAADAMQRVPPTHPDYYRAQREALLALEQAIAAAGEGPAKAEAIARVREQASALRADAEAHADEPDAPGALAAVRLALSGAAMAEGKVDEAITELDGFESRFDDPALVQLALERRIIALAQANRLQQLEAAAQSMTQAFPNESAAVIDQVLRHLEERIGALRTEAVNVASQVRKADLEKQASDLASTASMLAELLVQWAKGQGYNAEQMLPYELILAESLRMAGKPKEAVEITTRLVGGFPQEAAVLSAHADALFSLGGDEALLQAAGFYDRIIQGFKPPYPESWWNAWLKRLQIIDKLGGATKDIPLRIRQLKATDPNLGGPRFKDAFEQLSEKHSR